MSETNLKGIKIVWVEDDKFLISLIQKRVLVTGAELIQVTDGARAFDTIKQSRPNVVVLDLLMPNLDGFEILGKLKADSDLKHIPVLVLSNLGQKQEIEKAHELGAAKFVVKASIGLDGIIPEIEKMVKG
jgi:two-component system phosphate regulon response regulator PhoB/two-component system alkaline phosphatase synthesis response regulator PhoP